MERQASRINAALGSAVDEGRMAVEIAKAGR